MGQKSVDFRKSKEKVDPTDNIPLQFVYINKIRGKRLAGGRQGIKIYERKKEEENGKNSNRGEKRSMDS